MEPEAHTRFKRKGIRWDVSYQINSKEQPFRSVYQTGSSTWRDMSVPRSMRIIWFYNTVAVDFVKEIPNDSYV